MFDPDTISALKWLALALTSVFLFIHHFVSRVG
jgi:hypothetical protein